jgi:hypothetical protein
VTKGGAPAKSGTELKARHGDKIVDPLAEAKSGEAARQLAKERKVFAQTHDDVISGPKGGEYRYVMGEGGTGVATGWPQLWGYRPGYLPN